MAKKAKEVEPKETGCVLYVDGGCRSGYPNDALSQYGGWGIHGYKYNIGVSPTKPRTKKDIPTIFGYQDGTKVELNNQVIPTGYIDGWGSLSNKETNNSAELHGFINSMGIIKNLIDKEQLKKAQLLLDSQYVIKGINEFYPRWEARNWMKSDNSEPIANAILWQRAVNEYKQVSANVDICVNWVKGHSGDLGNTRADNLATTGVFVGRNGVLDKTKIKHSPVAKYGSPDVSINRLFQKNRLYFNTQEQPLKSKDGRFVYHCGAHGDDDTLVGMRMHDSCAYVVYTKEQEVVLEAIRQQHRKLIPNPLNELCMMKLDIALLPRIYQQIQEDTADVLSQVTRGYRGICTTNGQMVTRVVEPSGLTFKLIDVHNLLCDQLDDYLEGKGTFTDVTSIFYTDEKIKVKKEMVDIRKSKLSSSDKVIRADVWIRKGTNEKEDFQYPIRAKIGIDTPSKELIASIGSRNPKVTCITQKISDHFFTYGFVFDCGDDVMYWVGKDTATQLIWDHGKKCK